MGKSLQEKFLVLSCGIASHLLGNRRDALTPVNGFFKSVRVTKLTTYSCHSLIHDFHK